MVSYGGDTEKVVNSIGQCCLQSHPTHLFNVGCFWVFWYYQCIVGRAQIEKNHFDKDETGMGYRGAEMKENTTREEGREKGDYNNKFLFKELKCR